MYRDAASAWGHRAALLIQNIDPVSAENGFDNNYGATSSEGFIGFGIKKNIANYSAACSNPALAGNIVVFMELDPSTSFNATALPLSLISFNLKKQNANSILLDWKTTNEANNSGFEVERASMSNSFKKINFVAANTIKQEVNQYQYSDNEISDGIFYYRLKLLDLNGSYSYSKILSIQMNNNDLYNVSVNPNPAKGKILLKGVDMGDSIELYNSNGFLMHEAIINTHNVDTIPIAFPSGNYIILIKRKAEIVSKKINISN
jgi:hypothetical protein